MRLFLPAPAPGLALSSILGVAVLAGPDSRMPPSPPSSPSPPPGAEPAARFKPLRCEALPDDPPGLLREGFGCDARGGSGTRVIRVTALGPDGAEGTLRWAYEKIDADSRRVVFDPLAGEVPLEKPLLWRKPYTTLDMSQADVTIVTARPARNGIVVGATHDVIFYGVRGRGHYQGQPGWKPVNNAGILTLDGDSGPIRYGWDDRWERGDPRLRKGVRSSIFDRNTLSGCEDDCLACWCGVRDVSITRNLIHGSFHPSTSGCVGMPLPGPRQRLRIFWGYNVWTGNGERQVKPREATHWWVYARNIVEGWKCYPYTDPRKGDRSSAWCKGLDISDDYANENDLGWVVANRFIPGSDHPEWGITVGNSFGCDAGGKACPGSAGTDYACCNPKMKNTRWYFEANEGAASEGRTNPPGWTPPELPFAIDKARPWSRVLAEAGVPRRNAAEQSLVDRIAARLPAQEPVGSQ